MTTTYRWPGAAEPIESGSGTAGQTYNWPGSVEPQAPSGGGPVTGTVDAQVHHVSADAAGTVLIEGVADAQVHHASVDATGGVLVAGSADADVHHVNVDATGSVSSGGDVSGTVDADVHHAAVSATGTVLLAGVGDTDVHHATTSASGTVLIDGAADADVHHVLVSATGTVTSLLTGVGDCNVHHVSVAAFETQESSSDGTSGGNYGTTRGRVFPIEPRRKKKRARQAPAETTAREEFEKTLDRITGFTNAPEPSFADATKLLLRFAEAPDEQPLSRLELLTLLAEQQAQMAAIFRGEIAQKNLRESEFARTLAEQIQASESRVISSIGEVVAALVVEQDRVKILATLERLQSQERADAERLAGLLVALSET